MLKIVLLSLVVIGFSSINPTQLSVPYNCTRDDAICGGPR